MALNSVGKWSLLLPLIGVLGIVTACQRSLAATRSFDRSQVQQEVTAAVWAFHAADTSRNAQAVLEALLENYEGDVDLVQTARDKLQQINRRINAESRIDNSSEFFDDGTGNN